MKNIVLLFLPAILTACVSTQNAAPRAPAQAADLTQFGYTNYLTMDYARTTPPSKALTTQMIKAAVAADKGAFGSDQPGKYEDAPLAGPVTSVTPGVNRWKLPYAQTYEVRDKADLQRYIVAGNVIFRQPWVAASTQHLNVYTISAAGKITGTQSFSEFAVRQVHTDQVHIIRMMGNTEAGLWAKHDVAGLAKDAQGLDMHGFAFPVSHFNVGRKFYENKEALNVMSIDIPTALLATLVQKHFATVGFYDDTDQYGGIEIAFHSEAWPELMPYVSANSFKQ
jgi:hypothetical protein